MSFSFRLPIGISVGILFAVTAIADSLPWEPQAPRSTLAAPTACRAFRIGLTPEYAERQRREDARRELAAREAEKTALELRAYVMSRLDRIQPSDVESPTPRARPISAAKLVQASAYLGRPATAAVLAANTALNATIERRYYLYDPEGRLIAETEVTSGSTPRIQYEYVWFGDMPVAQIEQSASGPPVISYYFTDQLGAPILQTNELARVVWQAEYEPFGRIYAMRVGEGKYQPLRFPGQIADIGSPEPDVYYNVHRYYRASWGRYTQSDPIGLQGGLNLFQYAMQNPVGNYDRDGLSARGAINSLNDLRRWVSGDLPPVSAADPASTQDLAGSPVMDEIRRKYKQAGCKDGRYYGDFQYRQLATTSTITAQLVGSFGVDIRSINGCMVVIKAFNTWGTESASRWPALPSIGSNRNNPTVMDMIVNGAPITWPRSTFPNVPPGNPLSNATINYVWSEDLCCCP